MWTFYQVGELVGPDEVRHPAYSGKGEHKNDPASQEIENWGPIPCGIYHIGSPYDSPTHGPFVLPLTPDAANNMFGRHSFLIHGDSVKEPGTASEGCVIAPRVLREQIYKSGDKQLVVAARPPAPAVATDPGMEAE